MFVDRVSGSQAETSVLIDIPAVATWRFAVQPDRLIIRVVSLGADCLLLDSNLPHSGGRSAISATCHKLPQVRNRRKSSWRKLSILGNAVGPLVSGPDLKGVASSFQHRDHIHAVGRLPKNAYNLSIQRDFSQILNVAQVQIEPLPLAQPGCWGRECGRIGRSP